MLRQNWLVLLLSSASLGIVGVLTGVTGEWRVAGMIWIAGFGMMAVLLGVISLSQRSSDARRESGSPGVAIIRSIEQRGGNVTFNQRPLLTLGLEVHPDGLPPYELRKRLTVPLAALGRLQVGNTLAVHVDPDKPKRLDVDWGLE